MMVESSEYPVRPGTKDCQFYLRTGRCGYGENCCYNHPKEIPTGKINMPKCKKHDDVEKFGSIISHMGHYSEIAEKSVEISVSAISSSRYSGSGSRASCPSAPLKDIHNTCPSKG
ncbi:hypothetical protein F2Q68_00014690 [Brassica cretica]|uniref:C3H1-type domain-containing protein n=1 Tax=Brassica cretica TaxID=69181 RepID=A0A8S9HK34_BRACR|nr:hypothetical protein F2Q68_00014690 [Brassica cretica]